METLANAGRLLQRLRWQAGEAGKKKAGFSHDVLIALSARQIGATVLTSNAVDFERIRSLARLSSKSSRRPDSTERPFDPPAEC